MRMLLILISLLCRAVSSIPAPLSLVHDPLLPIRGGAQLSDDDDDDNDVSTDDDFLSDTERPEESDLDTSANDSEGEEDVTAYDSESSRRSSLPRSPIQLNPDYDPSAPTDSSSILTTLKKVLSKVPLKYMPLFLLLPSRFAPSALRGANSTTLLNFLWILLLLKRHFDVDIFDLLGAENRRFFPAVHKDKQNVRVAPPYALRIWLLPAPPPFYPF